MNPYESLDKNAFWATAVAKRNMFDIDGLWDPKFRIGKEMQVATYGSCFAQHIGRALKDNGYHWMIAEQAPEALNEQIAHKFNYGIFSARTGNIYTVSLLKQWVDWATGVKAVPDEVWEKDGRFYDPFRPNIEPGGFESREELLLSREVAIAAFLKSLTDAAVFVFTLGLTESWVNKQGHEYPMCPGTVAGEFDATQHEFVQQDFPFIRKTFNDALLQIKNINPGLRILLTVSPVPLTATMSGNHVLVATMESKSVLRAVAGTVQRERSLVDYFPSYEIINATPFRGTFFEANQRSVNHSGVNHVMNLFFSSLHRKFPSADKRQPTAQRAPRCAAGPAAAASEEHPEKCNPLTAARDIVCEDELLSAFGK